MENPKHKKKLAITIIIGALIVAVVIVSFVLHPSGASVLQADAAIYQSIPTGAGQADFTSQSNGLSKSVDPQLVDFDKQVITCAPTVDSLLSATPSYQGSCVGPTGGSLTSTAGLYLSGQCCSAMKDTVDYQANLQKLQAYKSMPDIILDPMHTPIALAKQWIDYDNATKLTPAQQAIMDQAMGMSKEKPCCCKCWHYFVNEGIAKKMIIDGTFNAQQIAAFWDASDICGS